MLAECYILPRLRNSPNTAAPRSRARRASSRRLGSELPTPKDIRGATERKTRFGADTDPRIASRMGAEAGLQWEQWAAAVWRPNRSPGKREPVGFEGIDRGSRQRTTNSPD